MNRAGVSAFGGFPRNRRRECVIDFKNPRSVAKILQFLTIGLWQSIAGNPGELPNRGIEKRDARLWQLMNRVDRPLRFELAAELAKIIGQSIGNRLRTAARHRPADGMTGRS